MHKIVNYGKNVLQDILIISFNAKNPQVKKPCFLAIFFVIVKNKRLYTLMKQICSKKLACVPCVPSVLRVFAQKTRIVKLIYSD